MRLGVVFLVSLVVGFPGGVPNLFVPEEPYRYQILVASTLKGVLMGLLTGLSLNAQSPWWHGVGLGAVYGLAFGLVVFLAKGGLKSNAAPYVVPMSALTGAVAGLLLVALAF